MDPQRCQLGAVLRRIQDNDIFESQQPQNIKRDKVDEVFDLEIIDESMKQPTAGEELDADFSQTAKCFSFSVTGQQKLANAVIDKNKSMKFNLNIPVIDDFEDSLNQRVSNPSENTSQKANTFAHQLFKGGSVNDSEKIDMKSGHFNISSSPSPNQLMGSSNQEKRPSLGSFYNGSPNEKEAAKKLTTKLQTIRSPNQKVTQMQKPQPKDFKPSIMISNFEKDTILRDSDNIDSEASPLTIPGKRQRAISRSGGDSLNTSTVEQEGKIGSSPNKNKTNQLFGQKNQNPFENTFVKQDKMAFTNQLNNTLNSLNQGGQIIVKRNIKIINSQQNSVSPVKKMKINKSPDLVNNLAQKIILQNQEKNRNGPKFPINGSQSPIEGTHAGKIAFIADQGKKIIKGRIQSAKRQQSAVNSGLKIKLKGFAYKNSQGPEEINANNNINMFTQEADIQPELRKKTFNTGDKNMIISNFEYQKQKNNFFEVDDLLKETPKNEDTNITSFQMLFKILGVPYNEDSQTFQIGPRKFNLDVHEMLKDSRKDFRVRTHRSGGGKSENVILSRPPSDFENRTGTMTSMLQRAKNKTPRIDSVTGKMAMGGIGSVNPGHIDSSSISERFAQSRNSKSPNYMGEFSVNSQSHHNLLVPGGSNMIQSTLIKRLDYGTAGMPAVSDNAKSGRSAISGLSRSRDKSPIVNSHQIKAERLRSKSKNKLNGLQMERQNMTENSNNLLLNSNQFSMIPKGKNNNSQQNLANQRRMKGTEVFSKGQINFGGEPFSGSGGTGTISSHQNLSLQGRTQTQKSPVEPPLMMREEDDFDDDEVIGRKESNTFYHQRDQIHLAFLFASPLMLKTSDNKYYDVLPPISFAEEFEQIKQSIEQKKIAFNYRYSVATSTNLQAALRDNPIGLHFSGHGFQNTESLYQGDQKGWLKYKGKGDVLIFENENGASEFFFTSDLQNMISDVKNQLQKLKTQNEEITPGFSNETPGSRTTFTQMTETPDLTAPTSLQFVYVASCHSEQVGKIFLEAGIPHVICIDQNQTILDKAAIEFSKFFYDEVFDCYNNICDAYKYAKKKVEDTFGKFQAEKIKMLTNEDTHGEICPEQKDLRLKPLPGEICQIGLEAEILLLPNKVSPFVSRNQDMLDVLKLLTQNNIVQIFGMPGLGKSSLLKNVTCFLGERDIYKSGVFYIDFLHVTTFKEAIQILSAYLMEDNYYDQYQTSFQDEFQGEVERLKGKISSFKKKFLISMDNIDHLEKSNHEQFLKFLNDIGSPQIKIIFTSNKFQMDIINENFSVKKIQKLKKYDSVDLFMKKIPLADGDKEQFLDYENIQELHKITVEKYGEKSDFVPKLCKMKHVHTKSCIMKYLQSHPIFEFLSGIPLVISIVAPFSVEKSLSEIFLYLAEKNDDHFKTKLQKNINEDSLVHCLEYCTSYFEKMKDRQMLELWYMIGIQGPGILYVDLKEIYCVDTEEDRKKIEMQQKAQGDELKEKLKIEQMTSEQILDKNLEDLINFSVIEVECLDKAGTMKKYRASPFVNKYIQEKMPVKMKQDSLNIVCTHLQSKLIQFKQQYAKDVVSCLSLDETEKLQMNLLEQLKPYEQQIMHIVSQMFKIEQKISGDKDESDSIDTDEDMKDINPTDSTNITSVKTSQQSLRPKSKQKNHARAVSRDVPTVSDYVKYSRSTFVASPGDQSRIKQMLQKQDPLQRMDSQIVLTNQKNPREIMGLTVKDKSPFNNTIGLAPDKLDVPRTQYQTEKNKELFDSHIDTEDDNRSKSKKRVVILDRRRSPNTQNLSFIQMKDSFHHERDASYGIRKESDDLIDYGAAAMIMDRDQEYREEKKNPQDDDFERDEEHDELFVKLDKRQSDETKINPFQVAKAIGSISNNQWCEMDSIEHLCYDENDARISSSHEAPNKEDIRQLKRRETQLLKGLRHVEYDENSCGYNRIRQSVLDKSLSRGKMSSLHNQLAGFKNNPDMMTKTAFNMDLMVIPEQSNSAPPKTGCEIISEAAEELEQRVETTLLQLKIHEELFFHNLSILAIIPSKRAELLNILDFHGQRQQTDIKEENEEALDLVNQAEKRLKKFKTVVDIPTDAKLLRANTMMLELFVQIQEGQFSISGMSLQQQKSQSRYIDSIYEMAHEMRRFFEQINFQKGLAIVDYIQAKRKFKKFAKKQEFKQLLKQACLKFKDLYEIDGISQCHKVAINWLKVKDNWQKQDESEDQQFIQELLSIYNELNESKDEQTKEFIKFRKEIIINSLTAKVVRDGDSNKISVDLIYNMLLNPQYQLQIQL